MLLQALDINKHYGGIAALKSARFSVEAGEVHALMGENGAGKSTLAKIIAGSVRADSGRILIDGQPVTIATPLDAQRHGIGIIYQELDLFPNLSVGENIVIRNLHFRERGLNNARKIDAFARPFLEQVGLDCDSRKPAASLSIGRMQLLAIARALSMNARVILMDEPTSALFDDSAERLFERIAALKQEGVAIVYVSHKMDEIFRICDRVTVLRDGETIDTREIASTKPAELIRLMVGREINLESRHEGHDRSGEVLLSADQISTARLAGVSFKLHRGEVLGVAGLVGAGRSELGEALFGLDPIRSGSVTLNGREFHPRSPRDAMDAGLALLPEDRKLQGLMLQMSILENGTMSILARLSTAGIIRPRDESAAVNDPFRRLALKAPRLAAAVNSLSGGNQQKVLLAKCLLSDPSVIFLDDPARGIDVGAKQDIYRIIRELATADKGVILVSSELPELIHCCDRIMVLREGRVTAFFDAAEATQESIMTAATREVAS
ncbi:MAG TPA: sugar ABC transporter ATP-binding protein [Bryobacteraceae bacterium]